MRAADGLSYEFLLVPTKFYCMRYIKDPPNLAGEISSAAVKATGNKTAHLIIDEHTTVNPRSEYSRHTVLAIRSSRI